MAEGIQYALELHDVMLRSCHEARGLFEAKGIAPIQWTDDSGDTVKRLRQIGALLLAIAAVAACNHLTKPSPADIAARDVRSACRIIDGWPEDFLLAFKANAQRAASADQLKSEMRNYVDLQMMALNIKSPAAISIMHTYKDYWDMAVDDPSKYGSDTSQYDSIQFLQHQVMPLCSGVLSDATGLLHGYK